MEITLKAVDEVMERTGCSYAEAKDLLTKTDGDVLDAIILFESNQSVRENKSIFEGADRTADEIVAKVRELIDAGVADKFIIRDKSGKTVVSIPLGAGIIAGTAAFLAGGPLVLIAGLIARYGLDCRFVVLRKDGSEIVL